MTLGRLMRPEFEWPTGHLLKLRRSKGKKDLKHLTYLGLSGLLGVCESVENCEEVETDKREVTREVDSLRSCPSFLAGRRAHACVCLFLFSFSIIRPTEHLKTSRLINLLFN